MGREIRKVPKGWEHPRDEDGHLRPAHDQTYSDAVRENKTHEDYDPEMEFWDYDSPPDPKYYRPMFTAPADHIQIYETVSEGTPVSPVFASKDEMVAWLITQGHSKKAAERFAKDESAPSMIFAPGVGLRNNIDSLDLLMQNGILPGNRGK